MPLNPLEITGGLAIGEGLGGAIADTVEPRLQKFKNDQWAAHQDVPLDAEVAAEVAAENVDAYPTMEEQASFTGYDKDRFADLYGLALSAPGTGELLTMLRHRTIGGGDFTHGLRKAKLEPRWDTALAELERVRLSPAELALGIVRSTVADPGLLAVTLDTSGGVVPAYPTWPGDVTAEATAGGFDLDRLRVLVGAIGLPMSAQQAASAYFRDIIREPDFNRAILEGDTRPEWAPYILEQARQIPTAHDGIEWHLRGWTDAAGMYAQTARHGMSKADTDLLFQVLGRPLSFHQVFIGERRGGVYDGPVTGIDAAFLKSLRESNIRPEWYNLAWAQRYSYPSAFVLRALTQSGDISEADAHDVLLKVGWEPTFAAQVAAAWAGGTTAATDPHVTKAKSRLWTIAQTSYINGEITATDLGDAWAQLGVDATAQQQILAAWDEARTIARKLLTPTQIKKAWSGAVLNEQTNAAWTRDDALAALIARGYSASDANTFLEL